MRGRPPTQPHRALEFAGFRLDQEAGQLRRGAVAIPLRRKTWEVLCHLADRPGVLVTKRELLDAVWRDVAVTEDTLTQSILDLRRALGDDAREPRFLETVHGRRFRFLAAQPDVERPPAAVSTKRSRHALHRARAAAHTAARAQCGSTWYRPVYQNGQVAYQVVNPPA